MSSKQPIGGPPSPATFDDIVNLPGLSVAKSAVASLTEGQVRDAFLTRVVAGRDEREHRTAPSATVARQNFLAWCGR